MRCPGCGRETDGRQQLCPACGTTLQPAVPFNEEEGRTTEIPVQQPEPPAQPPSAPLYQSPFQQPTAGMPQQQYTPQPYPPAVGQYPSQVQVPYTQEYASPAGSIPLGLLMMLFGGAVVGSTFLQWLSTPRILNFSVNVSGWSTMRTGIQSLGGSGFNLVLTGQGSIFFTGFFSLLLGALILLCGIITLIRRRPGGVLTMLFALAAATVAAVNITMIYAKMEMSPGLGLWLFGGASIVALALGIVSLSSSG